ncbi:MAG: hypothetical protein K2K74_18805 [Lachnospiraceae bacterium]|nr:hypothetical protein [Lachnospiraceae bacterium]
MKIKIFAILLLTITGTLLIGGCENQDAGSAPETALALDLSASQEEPVKVDILSETIDSTFTETAMPIPEQAPAAEPTSQNVAPEAQKADNDATVSQKTDPATPAAQKTDNAAPADQKAEDTTSAATVNVTKTFQPNDGWTSDFSFQIPKDWNCTVDEDAMDWGFLIQVNNQEDASIRIYGQYGTINVGQFYTDAPTDFTTSSGLNGKFYQEKRTGEDGSFIDGYIVFDLKSYGVSFSMPETVYNEYKDTLQAIFLSIKIENIYTE